jgi:hypothetical protein
MDSLTKSQERSLASPKTNRDHWLVFSDDWGRHPSSCQHLIMHLLDRIDVTWVNTIGMRPPRLDRVTFDRVMGKLRGAIASDSKPSSKDEIRIRPRVLSPWMWPWFKRGWDRACNRWLLKRQLMDPLQGDMQPKVAVTTIPIVADLMDELPVDRWVYYCVDDFSHWPGLDQRTMANMEKRVVERADFLVAASTSLQDRLSAMGRKSALCTHGVDIAAWQAVPTNRHAWPASIRGPIALFWGVIDRRLDTVFLTHLSQSVPQLSIVLVGPIQNPDPAIRRLPNVHILPPVATRDLPAMAQAADCLIMPYVRTPLTQAMQPLKLKEYLASGRPAVVRRLPSTEPWSEACDAVDTAEGFVRAVRRRIEGGLTMEQRTARRSIESESWSRKANRFFRLVSYGE